MFGLKGENVEDEREKRKECEERRDIAAERSNGVQVNGHAPNGVNGVNGVKGARVNGVHKENGVNGAV